MEKIAYLASLIPASPDKSLHADPTVSFASELHFVLQLFALEWLSAIHECGVAKGSFLGFMFLDNYCL